MKEICQTNCMKNNYIAISKTRSIIYWKIQALIHSCHSVFRALPVTIRREQWSCYWYAIKQTFFSEYFTIISLVLKLILTNQNFCRFVCTSKYEHFLWRPVPAHSYLHLYLNRRGGSLMKKHSMILLSIILNSTNCRTGWIVTFHTGMHSVCKIYLFIYILN